MVSLHFRLYSVAWTGHAADITGRKQLFCEDVQLFSSLFPADTIVIENTAFD